MATSVPADLRAHAVPTIGAGRKAVARMVLTGRVDPVAKVTGHSRLLVAREKMGHCLRRVTIEITPHASSQRRGPATLNWTSPVGLRKANLRSFIKRRRSLNQ